ncbi:hypothetical protein, partial [Clostridium tarantellae]|uniref:hypothetical protein n=1 Tax=Clostridium tarantellae TaxID=39493 RepID=UPI001478D1EC
FNNGEFIKEINLNKEENKEESGAYSALNSYVSINFQLDINNKFIRILTFMTINEINNNEVLASNDNLIKELIKYKDLFHLKGIKLEERIIRDDVKDLIKKLEKRPNEYELKKIINKCNDGDTLFTFINIAPIILGKPLNIDLNIEAIRAFKRLEYYDIKVALFCEELLKVSPIILDDIISFLKQMYKNNIFTEDSKKVLEYVKCTTKIEEDFIDLALLKMKVKEGIFDLEFLREFERLYEKINDKEEFDDIINKLINVNLEIFRSSFVEPIYDFYKRNNDFNALNILVKLIFENNLIKHKYMFTLEDVLILWNNKKDKNIVDENIINLSQKFLDNMEVKNNLIQLFKWIYLSNNKDNIKIIDEKYMYLLKELSSFDVILRNKYIYLLVNNMNSNLDNEDIKLLQHITKDDDVEITIKLNSLKILLQYFIKIKNYDLLVEYLNNYIDIYSSEDEGQVFKELVIMNKQNFEFIETILNKINFAKIKDIDVLLNSLVPSLIEFKHIDLLSEIISYYTDKENIASLIPILIEYVERAHSIASWKYDAYILSNFDKLNNLDKEKVYCKLIKRKDLPLEFRVEHYYLGKNDENMRIIAREFVNENINNNIAKEIAAEYYYDKDNEFLNVISIGKSNEKTLQLVYSKVRDNFVNNKPYVEYLLEVENNKNNELNILSSYIEKYNEEQFSENKNIVEDFKVINRINGYSCDKVDLENIFTGEVLESVFAFKNFKVENIMKRYLELNNIEFKHLENGFYFINFSFKKSINNIKDFLNKVIKLINLQEELIREENIIIYFREEDFYENELVLIPKNLEEIKEFKKEFSIRDKNLYRNLKEIKNKNGYLKINESSIVRIIKEFISEKLKKLELDDYILEKIKENVIKNDSIKNYEELKNGIATLIVDLNKKFEEISLREKIKAFNTLEKTEQKDIIEEIIENKNTILHAKQIVISWEDEVNDKTVYLEYLLDCFNQSRAGLHEEDFQAIYDKVLEILKEITNISKENINSIYSMFISASDITGFSKEDIRKDLEQINTLDKNEKEFIKSIMLKNNIKN